jgi:hypothetical protein
LAAVTVDVFETVTKSLDGALAVLPRANKLWPPVQQGILMMILVTYDKICQIMFSLSAYCNFFLVLSLSL